MTDEKKLVEEILKRNEKALRQFYLHFAPKLLTFIKNKIADPQTAEEILQDSFLATLESLRDFRFRCKLFTFMCSIAHHKIVDYYRKKRLKNIVFSRLTHVEPLLATFFGPEEALQEELLRAKIQKVFRDIAPRYRQILQLKYIYGFSVEEIARKLTISFKSAESQLFRARKAFVTNFSYEKR